MTPDPERAKQQHGTLASLIPFLTLWRRSSFLGKEYIPIPNKNQQSHSPVAGRNSRMPAQNKKYSVCFSNHLIYENKQWLSCEERSCQWVNGNNPGGTKLRTWAWQLSAWKFTSEQTTAPGPGCSASTLYLNFALCANWHASSCLPTPCSFRVWNLDKADSVPVLSCSAYNRCLVNISITVVFFLLEDPGRDRSAGFCGRVPAPCSGDMFYQILAILWRKCLGPFRFGEMLGIIKISSLTAGFLKYANMHGKSLRG